MTRPTPRPTSRPSGPNSLVGTVAQIRERLLQLEEIGVERVMLQYLTHRDLDGVDYIAELAEE